MRTEVGGATIANGASQSSVVDLHAVDLLAIQMPAAWTAANLTFLGSADNVTFDPVKDSGGTEITVTAAASTYIVLSDVLQPELKGVRYLKIRSGTAGAPVNQGAARTLVLITEADT